MYDSNTQECHTLGTRKFVIITLIVFTFTLARWFASCSQRCSLHAAVGSFEAAVQSVFNSAEACCAESEAINHRAGERPCFDHFNLTH